MTERQFEQAQAIKRNISDLEQSIAQVERIYKKLYPLFRDTEDERDFVKLTNYAKDALQKIIEFQTYKFKEL